MRNRLLVTLFTLSMMITLTLAAPCMPTQETYTGGFEDVIGASPLFQTQENTSLLTEMSELDQCRQRILELESQLARLQYPDEGFAALQGPAVMRRIERSQDRPGASKTVSEGAMLNISAEMRPGKGRILVETEPLMGLDFQEAAHTAAEYSMKRTGTNLSGHDIIFSIEAPREIPEVDGPSAGALMTLLALSALEDRYPRDNLTLTGTIDAQGNVGRIGGIVEKAEAAKENGKSLFLLPAGNSRLVQPDDTADSSLREQGVSVVDAKEYIEATVGIPVEYVDTIDDVLEYAWA
jgi:hypothetical protein